MEIIKKQYTLDYWDENGWYEGRLREIPEVLSQGNTLDELQENVREDCALALSDPDFARRQGYKHLDPADIRLADLTLVQLNDFQSAVAQLQALSPGRRQKVFAYIEDLLDLEAFERRAREDDARNSSPEPPED
jgi:predicted RNase H-like HicB family nuclease